MRVDEEDGSLGFYGLCIFCFLLQRLSEALSWFDSGGSQYGWHDVQCWDV